MSNSDRMSQCESSLSEDLEESGESYDFIDDNTDETNVSDSHGILLSLLNKKEKLKINVKITLYCIILIQCC